MDLIRTPAVVIERPFEAAFRPVALTPKRADTVVAQTLWSAISTGTDMKTYRGEQHPEQCYYPLVPGYENMGVILEEGSYAPDLKAGDRVMINECRKYGDVCAAWGGGTRLVHKDSDNAGGAGDPMCKVPDNVSDTDAVLAYLACVPLKGLEKFDLRPTDTVVVVGAGMVGISAMQLLKIKCPGIRVIAIEKNGFRREIAQHYADVVLPHDDTTERKLLDLTGGKKPTRSWSAAATRRCRASCTATSRTAAGATTTSPDTSTCRATTPKSCFSTTITAGSRKTARSP